MNPDNDYRWWTAALHGNPAAIDANTPQPGFYRIRYRRRLVPIAYWNEGTALHCQLNGTKIHPHHAVELWPFASMQPVSHADYKAWKATGKWPDEHQAVLNHNQAPPDDSLEAVRDRIDDLTREAAKMIEAGAAQQEPVCNQASDLANTLAELEGKADTLRVREKEPHLEAGRDVDRKWMPLRDKAADFKKELKRVVVTPFLVQRQKEADAAETVGVSSPRTTAGITKRSTALRTVRHAVIEDLDALIEAIKEHPDVIAALQKIANKAAQSKVALPGCRVITEQRAA